MDASGAIDDTLAGLQEMGVALAIDDFGTGYSSLAYLNRFPLDHLKIDRSFINDVCKRREAANIVAAIIAMAHTLDLEVIAEGIEDAKQLEFLQSKGGDAVQGFLIGKPTPNDGFERFLRTHLQGGWRVDGDRLRRRAG